MKNCIRNDIPNAAIEGFQRLLRGAGRQGVDAARVTLIRDRGRDVVGQQFPGNLVAESLPRVGLLT
jgi:hypothetical protein